MIVGFADNGKFLCEASSWAQPNGLFERTPVSEFPARNASKLACVAGGRSRKFAVIREATAILD